MWQPDAGNWLTPCGAVAPSLLGHRPPHTQISCPVPSDLGARPPVCLVEKMKPLHEVEEKLAHRYPHSCSHLPPGTDHLEETLILLLSFSCSIMSDFMQPHGLYSPPGSPALHCLLEFAGILFAFSYCLWGSRGKNTGVMCRSILQRTMFCLNSPL